LWLLTQGDDKPDGMEAMPIEMRPERSKVIVDIGSGEFEHVITLHVDRSRPDAWRAPAYEQLIRRWLNDDAARVFVVCGTKRRLLARTLP
jgi:hypothetical protein